MWRWMVVVVVVDVALNLGCSPCTRLDSRPESVCLPADGGELHGQPFELQATVSGPAARSCLVSVDAGVIDLTLTGEDCTAVGPSQGTKPILVMTTTRCAIPALEAGQYTVLGTTRALNVVLNVGGDAGPGVTACP